MADEKVMNPTAEDKGVFEVENEEATQEVDMSLKNRIYVLFEDPTSGTAALTIAMVINVMIILSTITFVLETMPSLGDVSPGVWLAIEIFCIVGFTIDFVIRLLNCPSLKDFCTDIMNWIDFVAILPFYIEQLMLIITDGDGAGLTNLRLIRVIRLARVLRIFKMGGSGDMGAIIVEIVQISIQALGIPMYFLICCLVGFGSLMFYIEKAKMVECGSGISSSSPCKDPLIWGTDLNAPVCYCLPAVTKIEYTSDFFPSIPEAIWWCIVTMTTVGYGDKYPRSWFGKTVGLMTMMAGIFFLAMPLTIVGTSFNTAWEGVLAKRAKREMLKHEGEQPSEYEELLAEYSKLSTEMLNLEDLMKERDLQNEDDMTEVKTQCDSVRKMQETFARDMASIFETFHA